MKRILFVFFSLAFVAIPASISLAETIQAGTTVDTTAIVADAQSSATQSADVATVTTDQTVVVETASTAVEAATTEVTNAADSQTASDTSAVVAATLEATSTDVSTDATTTATPALAAATVAQTPDLTVSLTHTPTSSIDTLTPVTVTAVVTNGGTLAADPSILTLNVGGEVIPATFGIPTLAPNASYTVTRVAPLGIAQDYQVTATADATNVVAESNETNNVAVDVFTVTQPGAKPDLVITSLSHTPSAPTTSDTITLTAVVTNQGSAGAGASVLSLGLGEAIPPTFGVPALAPHGTFTVTHTTVLSIAQNYQVTAKADAGSQVDEADETNNTATDVFAVVTRTSTSTPGADLTVSLTHTPTSSIDTLTPVTVTAVVTNGGTLAADPSILTLNVGGEVIPATFGIPTLAPNASYTVTRVAPLGIAQDYQVTATADATNVVAESNETNNVAVDVFTVAAHVDTPPGGGGGGGGGGGFGGGNSGPSFTSFNSGTTACVNQKYTYAVQASDQDSPALTYTLLVHPAGMTINAASGLIEWTTTADQVRESPPYDVQVQVSDGLNTIKNSYQITVTGGTCTTNNGGGGGGTQNLPPNFLNFNPGTVTRATELYSYHVEAKDPENQPLTFSLLLHPDGMLITPEGTIVWIPSLQEVSATPYAVTVQVSDGTNATKTSYSVVVRSPEIKTIPEQPIAPSQPVSNTGDETPVGSTSISISTNSNDGTPLVAGEEVATPLLAGVFNLLGSLGDWLRGYYCVLGYILWLLTLLILAIYVLTRRGERDEDRVRGSGSRVVEQVNHDLDTASPVVEEIPISLHAHGGAIADEF